MYDLRNQKILLLKKSGLKIPKKFQKHRVFFEIFKSAIFRWAILEKPLELSKRWGRKWLMQPAILKKMYLVEFRKSSKMGRNLHKDFKGPRYFHIKKKH